jgi:hypothetical protein
LLAGFSFSVSLHSDDKVFRRFGHTRNVASAKKSGKTARYKLIYAFAWLCPSQWDLFQFFCGGPLARLKDYCLRNHFQQRVTIVGQCLTKSFKHGFAPFVLQMGEGFSCLFDGQIAHGFAVLDEGGKRG